MKQGYKQTEVGVIPEDWGVIPFSKCFDTINNNTLSRAELNYDGGKIRNIHYGDVLISFPSIVDCQKETIPYVNEDAADGVGNSFLQDGDVVIADTAEDNTVGKAVEIFNIGDSKVVAGLHTMPCRPKNRFLNVLSNTVIDASSLGIVDIKNNEQQNKVKKGDLFFNTSSETPEEVGMCAVLNTSLENTYLNSFCFGFRLKDKTHEPLFLSYYFNSFVGRRIMSVLAQGATRYNLSKNNFADTVIKLPQKGEQIAIASFLLESEIELDALKKKLIKIQKIKSGMMSELLTGKKRLM